MKNINYISDKRMEEMAQHGWIMVLAKFRETPSELFNRLSKTENGSYDKVKIYYTSTRVRGIHDYLAFVK